MFKLSQFLFLTCITIILAGGIAWGECVDDGNNDAGSARKLGLTDSIIDVVCPDIDPIDYYFFEVAEGTEVRGTVAMESEQVGTVIRITGPDGDIFEAGTTDSLHELVYTIPGSAAITEGTYYARISFWSEYEFDHEYMLTLDLTVAATPIVVGEGGILRGVTPAAGMESSVAGGIHRPVFELLPSVPWPSLRCGATHRGRSAYNGPPSATVKKYEHNVRSDFGYAAGDGNILFGILSAEDDRVYVSGYIHVAAYDVTSGMLWQHTKAPTWYPAYLDGGGNVYVLEFGQEEIVSIAPDGSERWSVNSPTGENYSDIIAVGRRVYASRQDGMNFYVDVYETDGSLAYTAGPMEDSLRGMVEDPGAAAYFISLHGLHQYNWSGVENWYVDFPHSADWIATGVTPVPPLVGRDHRVWIHSPWRKRTYVYNPDGTVHSLHNYQDNEKKAPVIACYGTNGNLYIGYKDSKIACYRDWINKLWEVQIPGTIGRFGMAQGSDNKLYIHYTSMPTLTAFKIAHTWRTLNPDTGATINIKNIDMPSEFRNTSRSELAIGDKGRLLYLNASGYLAVYEKGLRMLAPGFKPGIKKFTLRKGES